MYDNFMYYQTEAALVESKVASVDASQAGTVTSLTVKKGDTVTVGQKIGELTLIGGSAGQTQDLNSPVNGSVLLTVAKGSVVTKNYPIAMITEDADAAVGEATVVAFVDESVLNRLRIGQQADVTVDAYGGTIYRGELKQIVRQAANQFSQSQQTSDFSSGNFTKVSQRVPVLIGLDEGTLTNQLLQGLSAEVKIHLL
ncbi:MAG: biotin/lipoyl-binding protein [Chloroflexi bacterium]|nr:biotin/lipoyl-binding protein [Chloroflexota bacterium]